MATCFLCPNGLLSDAALADHFRGVHNDLPERWPDGSVVVLDMTLEPKNFTEENPDEHEH